MGRRGSRWTGGRHLDEVFVKANGEWAYLWRGLDPDGNVLAVLVQSRRPRESPG